MLLETPLLHPSEAFRSTDICRRMIYSDDHGETWALGGTPALPGSAGMMSESQVIELPDGSLMLFARNDTDQIASAVSTDGGSTWSAGRLEEALTTGGSD